LSITRIVEANVVEACASSSGPCGHSEDVASGVRARYSSSPGTLIGRKLVSSWKTWASTSHGASPKIHCVNPLRVLAQCYGRDLAVHRSYRYAVGGIGGAVDRRNRALTSHAYFPRLGAALPRASAAMASSQSKGRIRLHTIRRSGHEKGPWAGGAFRYWAWSMSSAASARTIRVRRHQYGERFRCCAPAIRW